MVYYSNLYQGDTSIFLQIKENHDQAGFIASPPCFQKILISQIEACLLSIKLNSILMKNVWRCGGDIMRLIEGSIRHLLLPVATVPVMPKAIIQLCQSTISREMRFGGETYFNKCLSNDYSLSIMSYYSYILFPFHSISDVYYAALSKIFP